MVIKIRTYITETAVIWWLDTKDNQHKFFALTKLWPLFPHFQLNFFAPEQIQLLSTGSLPYARVPSQISASSSHSNTLKQSFTVFQWCPELSGDFLGEASSQDSVPYRYIYCYLEQPLVVNRSCKFGVFFLRLLHCLEKWIIQLQLRFPHLR